MSSKVLHYDYLFKVVMVGDNHVGKSCIAKKFAHGTYTESNSITIGAEFYTKLMVLDGKCIKLQIWDTAGQEQFRTVVPLYYRLAHGIILVYDCTNQVSFQDLPYWLSSSRRYASDSVDRIIIGNKCDIEDGKVVDFDRAKQFANSQGLELFETSAKDGTNLQKAFVALVSAVKKRRESALELLDHADAAIELDSLADAVKTSCC